MSYKWEEDFIKYAYNGGVGLSSMLSKADKVHLYNIFAHSFNQLTNFQEAGKNICFSRKINFELSIVNVYLTKNKALR